MTPRELCDLASRINAAVPGLVPDMETWGNYDDRVSVVSDVIRLASTEVSLSRAAAMMLGRVDAWCRWAALNDHGGKTYTKIVELGCELDAYVATTLPGAKA